MEIEVATVIDRPIAIVWDFYAVRHIENHPRWDPTIELEPTSDGPIGVGTLIRRRATRFGRTTEGTMLVVAFEPERLMRVETHDGPMTILGWARFEAIGPGATRVSLGGAFPGQDESLAEQVRPRAEQSAATIKALIESET